MGLYTISCPICKQAHTWWSGNIDQRCNNCRANSFSAQINRLYDADFKKARAAVDGDLVWHDYHPKDHTTVRAAYLDQLRYGDFDKIWSNACQKMVEVNYPPRYDVS